MEIAGICGVVVQIRHVVEAAQQTAVIYTRSWSHDSDPDSDLDSDIYYGYKILR